MKIMVYCNNTESAERAREIALEHAKAFNASVYLVTSISGGVEIPKNDLDNTEKNLKQYAEKMFKSADIECKYQVLLTTLAHGEALVEFAEKNNIDEIIMGVKQRSKVGKLVFGSTTQYVILEAPCRVVTIR